MTTSNTPQLNKIQLSAVLSSLVEECGSDQKAAEKIQALCFGYSPCRATIGKLRRGNGSVNSMAMAVNILQNALKKC